MATHPPVEAHGRNGQLYFDGQFVILARKGFRARATVGKGEKRIPIRQVSSVQWKPAGPLVEGFIQFSLSGGNERRSALFAQTSTARTDENSVIFTRGQMPEFETVKLAVETAMAAVGEHPSAVAEASLADQLTALAGLRDQGIITDEEFVAKKTQMLGL